MKRLISASTACSWKRALRAVKVAGGGKSGIVTREQTDSGRGNGDADDARKANGHRIQRAEQDRKRPIAGLSFAAN